MTNEEAINTLKSLKDYYNDKNEDSYVCFDDEDNESIDMAIKALEQTRWIPVSERLPKADEYIGDVARYYLVQNEYGDMLVARYTHGEYWEQIYQLQPISDEIVAWMPLPEPYKAESEDKE